MFAVVEFMGPSEDESSHEISVVPLLWLQKHDTKCYWPIRTNNIPFKSFVQNCTPFKKSWPLYKVFKVHFKTASYNEAEEKLKCLVEFEAQEASGTDGSTRSLIQKRPINSSSSESESEDVPPFKKKGSEINIGENLVTSLQQTTSNSVLAAGCASSSFHSCASTVTASPGSPLTNSSSSLASTSINTGTSTSNTHYEENVLNTLSKILTDVEQHSVILNELLLFNKNIMAAKLVAPGNLPSFPLKTLEELQSFDDLIKKDEPVRQYMVRRLAALGGSDPESLTRRMLRFLITNEVGMLYNWKGTEKLPFKSTKIMEIIYEAGKLNFPQSDKNDERIEKAVKEWLKFSKSRLAKKSGGK